MKENYFQRHVPIVDYREFSLERKEPDVDYIHNSYDLINYVTSICLEYYPS